MRAKPKDREGTRNHRPADASVASGRGDPLVKRSGRSRLAAPRGLSLKVKAIRLLPWVSMTASEHGLGLLRADSGRC